MYSFSLHSPTPDEFAELVADSLVKRGAFSGEFLFDRDRFALLIKDLNETSERKICLSQLYSEYCAADVVTRQKVLMSASTRGDIQVDPEPVERAVKFNPEIVTRWSVEQRQLAHLSSGAGRHSGPNHEIFAGHFAILFSDNDDDALKSEQTLAPGALSADDALCRRELTEAIETLLPGSNPSFESLVHEDTGEVVLHMSICRDRFETARTLYSKEIELLPVRGDRLVFIINPNYLIVTGSECERGLMYAHSELKLASEESSPYPPIALLLQGGQYCKYDIPIASLWHKLFRESELKYYSDIYSQQKETLESDALWCEAGFKMLEFDVTRNKRGVLSSKCEIHSRELPCLVPSTEYVQLFDRGGLAASASMDRVRLICPELMQETGFYPTRFLMSKWPDNQHLEAIGRETFSDDR